MKYTKPVGATADLRELEYISALHQTGKTLRRDGSIKTDDIAKFLMSRYGIKVTEEEVTETIAKGFGGGDLSEEDGDTLDLVEMTAMMLVPTLLKAEMSLHRDHLIQEMIKSGKQVLNEGDEGEIMPDSSIKDSEFHIQKSGRKEAWASLNKTRALKGEDRWPDADLISFVLRMILADVTGDAEPKPMTKELLKKIFLFYEEHEVAENEDLLEEMIAVASAMKNADEECKDPMFDEFTFAHCLTDDVRRYDMENETKLSTHYSDVFVAKDEEDKLPTAEKGEARIVKTVWTAPSIDYAVDTFRGKPYVILLWVNWALFFYVFMLNEEGRIGELKCSRDAPSFGCQIAQGIVTWLLIMARLVIIGSGSVMLCSMGYDTNPTSPMTIGKSILSMGFICIFTIVPAFIEVKLVKDQKEVAADDFVVAVDSLLYDDPIDDPTYYYDDDYYTGALISTVKSVDKDQAFLVYVMVAFGVILLLLAVQNMLDRLIPARFLDSMGLIKKLFSSGTISMERNMKLAASFKINKMIGNARSIHAAADFEHGAGSSNRKESSYGRALLSFSKIEADYEEIGGCGWTWRRMWNKKLYTEDGIWLNNRMVQGNVGQLVLCLWLIPFLQVLLFYVNEFYDEFFADLVPEKWRILVPVALAFVLAECNALKLATSYTPSSVRTTMRYRYGLLGSLHDPEFLKVRKAVDDSCFIFGAMFWGCLFSSAGILIVSFLVFGLFCFEPFLPYLLQIIATIIGIGITIGIKNCGLMLARHKFHKRAFYRTNPAAANIIGVILDAWSLGITTLYILKRMIFLLSAAFIYIGRIDIPFLSEDADQVGPLTLDNFPFMFRKDILTHEAHRHPYLERIGVMYMLKLKHGEGFGREAGTSWRLLFVFAFMPWLRKYRMRHSDDFDVKKFIFSKDGPAFEKFVSAKAGGLHGRLSRDKDEAEDPKDDDADDEHESIMQLKKKIAKLREENEFLWMMRGKARE